jgi:hypothetical protein
VRECRALRETLRDDRVDARSYSDWRSGGREYDDRGEDDKTHIGPLLPSVFLQLVQSYSFQTEPIDDQGDRVGASLRRVPDYPTKLTIKTGELDNWIYEW